MTLCSGNRSKLVPCCCFRHRLLTLKILKHYWHWRDTSGKILTFRLKLLWSCAVGLLYRRDARSSQSAHRGPRTFDSAAQHHQRVSLYFPCGEGCASCCTSKLWRSEIAFIEIYRNTFSNQNVSNNSQCLVIFRIYALPGWKEALWWDHEESELSILGCAYKMRFLPKL